MNISAEASKKYSNVEPWKCTTEEAINKIKAENLSFDLPIIDADHSRRAVANDVSGFSTCRREMLDALNLKTAMHSTSTSCHQSERGRALGRVCDCL